MRRREDDLTVVIVNDDKKLSHARIISPEAKIYDDKDALVRM